MFIRVLVCDAGNINRAKNNKVNTALLKAQNDVVLGAILGENTKNVKDARVEKRPTYGYNECMPDDLMTNMARCIDAMSEMAHGKKHNDFKTNNTSNKPIRRELGETEIKHDSIREILEEAVELEKRINKTFGVDESTDPYKDITEIPKRVRVKVRRKNKK